MYDVTNGVLLASVDVPASVSAGLKEETQPAALWSRLRLLEVSADMSTAVVVTHNNTAAAIDLDDYFRLIFVIIILFLSLSLSFATF